MTQIFWLEQTEADLPEDHDWLSVSEAARADGMRFAKRRTDWLLGRWTAKCAVARYWKYRATPRMLASIEIRSAACGAPEVFFAGEAAAVTISLSHRAGRAMCAVAPADVALGCDLEMVEPRSDTFVADYFTAGERALFEAETPEEQPREVTVFWSAKESALKALGVGLRVDTRWVRVSPAGSPAPVSTLSAPHSLHNWRPLQVSYDDKLLRGWWQWTHNLVRTLIAAPPPRMPIAFGQNEEQCEASRARLMLTPHRTNQTLGLTDIEI